MANPVFSSKNSPFSSKQGGNSTLYAPPPAPSNVINTNLPAGYPPVAQPAGAMTIKGSFRKASLLLGITLVAGFFGWNFLPPVALLPLIIVGFVIAMVVSFKATTNPPLIIAYVVTQGLIMGALTAALETIYPGIAIQAILATASVFAVTFTLFSTGLAKATPGLRKVFMIGMVSYLLFSLLNLGLMMFGVTDGMFGLHSEPVFGIPLGILLGPVIIIMACISLILDFDFIKKGSDRGLEAKYEWTAAYGLMVTIIWLYLEILRFIALVRR